MRSVAQALPGLVLVLVLPGALALLVARVRVSLAEAVALIPTLALGVLWLSAEVCQVLGVGAAPWLLAAVLVVLALAAAVRWRTARVPFELDLDAVPNAPDDPVAERVGSPRGIRFRATRRLSSLLALGLLLGAVGLGAATWIGGMRTHSTVPPNFDSPQHGFMIERIARSGETTAAEVVVSDPRGTGKAANYYPLGLHAALALASRTTGSGPASLLNGVTILFAAVVLPCGLYALGRRVVPSEPLVAGFSALLGMVMAVFPYKPIGWGGITTIVGLAMVPGVVVVLDRVLGSGWSWAGAATMAVAVFAILAVHNSELPILALLVLLLLVDRSVRARSSRVLRDGLLRFVLVGAGAGVLFLPTLPSFFGGVSERSDFRDTQLLPFDALLGPVLSLSAFVMAPQRWLSALAIVGAGVMVWRHRLAWPVGALIVFALTLLAGTSDGALAGALTFPWYRQPERVMYCLVYFVPILAAVPLAGGCVGLAALVSRARSRASTWALPAAVVAAVFAVALVGGVGSARDNRTMLRQLYADYGPVGANEVAAFEWLGRHAPRDGLVVTDLDVDGSLWMYAFSGANPLFAAYPQEGAFRDRSFDERSYLHDHISQLGADPKLARILAKYRARYLYFGESTFRGSSHNFDLAQLRSVAGLREVWSRGGAHIFEITSS